MLSSERNAADFPTRAVLAGIEADPLTNEFEGEL